MWEQNPPSKEEKAATRQLCCSKQDNPAKSETSSQ
jgi:hypothetical protein